MTFQFASETLGGDASVEEVIHAYLQHAVDTASGKLTRVGLFQGLSGIAFAATAASRGGRRYHKLLATLNEIISSEALRLVSRVRRTRGQPTSNFDVISGLSGCLGYMLYTQDRDREVLSAIVEALIWLAGSEDGIPRLHTPAHLIVSPVTAASFPAGYVNCGLAHGLPGPMAALSIALLENFEMPGQRDAIRRCADYLLSHRISTGSDVEWPIAVSLNPNDTMSLCSHGLVLQASWRCA